MAISRSIKIKRSIVIDVPKDDILRYLKDFRHWYQWSPWLLLEPEATVSFHDKQGEVGCSYSWGGKRIGSGNMTLTSIASDELTFRLKFIKPFKSKATVNLLLSQPEDDKQQGDKETAEFGTQVSWTMESKLPFFMLPFKNMMSAMIALDYERGLSMLKSQLETGEVLSQTHVVGKRKQSELHYISIGCSGALQDMGQIWQTGVTQLKQALEAQNIMPIADAFGLYYSMDMSGAETQFNMEFDICLPIAAPKKRSEKKALQKTLKRLQPSLQYAVIEPCDTYVVQHQGRYPFLGNAWSMAYSMVRYEKIKTKRKPMGMEFYLNSPDEVEDRALLSEVVLFCR